MELGRKCLPPSTGFTSRKFHNLKRYVFLQIRALLEQCIFVDGEWDVADVERRCVVLFHSFTRSSIKTTLTKKT